MDSSETDIECGMDTGPSQIKCGMATGPSDTPQQPGHGSTEGSSETAGVAGHEGGHVKVTPTATVTKAAAAPRVASADGINGATAVALDPLLSRAAVAAGPPGMGGVVEWGGQVRSFTLIPEPSTPEPATLINS